MNVRRLAALALLAGATTAPACGLIGTPPASAAVACGGQNAMHQIPSEGDHFECEGSRQLLDGQVWSGFLTAYPDGTGVANVRVATPVAVDVPIELEVHYGLSGNGGVTFNAVIPAGQIGVAVPYNVNLTDFAQFGCLAQMDLKAFNGNQDTATNKVRILGPSVVWPNCLDLTSTVPATSSPTTTAPTASTSPDVSTTHLPPSSVVGGNLPATGPRRTTGNLIGWAGALGLIGALLVVATRKRTVS